MRHRDQANLHLFDPEPERTLQRLLREQRTEQTRDRTTMENNEDQNLDVERNEPQRGRNGNNGRNQAPMPFIQPDDPFMLLDEFVLPPTVVQTAIRRSLIQANNFELKSVTVQMLPNILFHGLLLTTIHIVFITLLPKDYCLIPSNYAIYRMNLLRPKHMCTNF